MNIEQYRDYCISKKAVTEHFPFDETTLVFKVMDKIFALTSVDDFTFINLKANPEKAIEMRERYNGVKPGYHMNKKHWNSVYVNQDLPDQLIFQMIDDSYNLIVTSLTKKQQQEFKKL